MPHNLQAKGDNFPRTSEHIRYILPAVSPRLSLRGGS